MSRRLKRAFSRAAAEGRAALVAFVEAGDPDRETSLRIVEALFDAGADVVELGVPFSDPIADGPVIQRAGERALASGGGLPGALDLAAELRRRGRDGAVVLFGYANPILAMGEAAFAARAAASGVDGVLVTDLPPEEARGLVSVLRRAGLSTVFLLAPTSTPERIRRARGLSRGFVYLLSRPGVTGARTQLPPDLPELVARVRQGGAGIPLAIGFGISTAEQVAEAARLGDGVVVGSALVSRVEAAVRGGRDPVPGVAARCRELFEATRR
ncbi:MAG: tryptophan synthase subunit alpha [Acidobacteria bacterium ACB2]|nr:tryptophan synthase subunit alpha [Acidobacteria bacterium ACB2]